VEQQAATSEVLKVISRSTFDLPPVLQTLVEHATWLCSADAGMIRKLDGEVLRAVAESGIPRKLYEFDQRHPLPPGRGTITGRAALERRTVHIHDVLADPEYQNTEAQQLGGYRTLMAVPMLREGTLIGVFVLYRFRVEPFTDRQIALLETFADQAVIAIENVRLFTELQEKNRALTEAHAQVTEALEQQTTTSDILRVISSSPTDTQPVFDAIVRSAVRLCDGLHGTAVRFDGELMHLAAGYNYTLEVERVLGQAFPMRPSPRTMSGRAILSRDVVQVEDALEDADYTQDVARAGGFRSMLAAPMLRDGRPIGTIVVNRGRPGHFSRTQIELLKTFASQAVIAIENVRLFKELQDKNRVLTAAHAR
jgi:GAF domain-containing protein